MMQPMKIPGLVLGALMLMLISAPAWTGEKKADKKAEEFKDVVVNDELINADLKDKVRTESYCKPYTFTMTAGKTYQIDMQSTDFDSYLRLEDPQGRPIAEDDDSGGMLNARIIYRVTKTGDYQIIATSLGTSTGKFKLTVKDTTVAKGDKAAGKPIELKINKGQATYTGNLGNDDPMYKNKLHKLFIFPMEAGKTYQIDHSSNAFDAYLFLEDPDGKLLDKNDDNGQNGSLDSRITYKAAKAGKYRIIASSLRGNEIGQFTLTIRETDAGGGGGAPNAGKQEAPEKGVKNEKQAPPADGKVKAIELKLDKAKTAEYEGELTGDDPVYQGRKKYKAFVLPMKEGKAYRIDLSSKAFDAYLYLEGPSGKVVDQNDDNGESLDSRIVYQAPKTGNYRIIATCLPGKANAGKFKLTVRIASADEARHSRLNKMIADLMGGGGPDGKELVKATAGYLESRGAKIDMADARLAMDLGQALEFGKAEKDAGSALQQFAKLISKAQDAKVSNMAKRMEGAGRRLTLVGNEMALKGKTLDGKEVDLKSLKGKVVLVDFWATWCGPCRAELPNIKKMYAKYHKQGFDVVGVSVDHSEDALKKFLAAEELPWSCIHDDAAKVGERLADWYGINSIPQAILVGRDGRVVSLHARGETLEQLLDKMIEEKK